jgi:GTP-binding protein EngB required for normal cell division
MFDHFAQLKENALQHLDKAAAFARSIKRDTIAQQIELGRRHLADSRYNIAIVGNMNRGKSTLLNTLLGRRDDHLSPIQGRVCTAAIVHYLSREAHPENLSEARVFFDGREPQSVPVEVLRDYITEDGNPGNIKEVRSVDVYGDFPLLRNVVTLVDTPGRGATQRQHETLLEQFLPVADAIIFLISADLPIEASERAFLDQLSQQEKQRIFFVLTKRDEVSDKDIKEVRNWVMKNIRESGLSCDRLFEVSAKPVFEAACAGKDGDELVRLRRDCGVADLESELEKYIVANSEKNVGLLPRLRSLLDYVSEFYFEATGQAEKDLTLLDGGAERIAGEVAQLQAEADALRASCTKCLQKFHKAWDKSVAQFRRKLEGRVDTISDRLLDRLSRGGLIGAASSAFKLRQTIGSALRVEMDVLLPELDQDLGNHAQCLQEEIAADWETYQRAKPGADMITPTVTLLALGGTASMVGVAVNQLMAAASALTAVSGASASQGGFAYLWAAMFGGGTAKAAAAVAWAAAPPAIFAVAGAVGVNWIAGHIIRATQENRVPELVRKTIEEMAASIAAKLEERRTEIEATYRDGIEEQIRVTQERLADLRKAIIEQDPSLKAHLARQVADGRSLMQEQRDLAHSVKLLPSS